MCVPFKLIPFGIFLVLFGIQSSCANLQQQETLQSSSLKTVGKSLGRRSFLASNYASSCIAGTYLPFPYKTYALYCAECGGGFYSNVSGKTLSNLKNFI